MVYIPVPRASRPRASSLSPGIHGTKSAGKLAVVSKASQNVYDVSISEQSQDIFTFDEGILTGTIKQKNNKHVSHTDEVNYIIEHSQTPNMEPQTLHKNQEMMTENCLQTMPQTDTANSSNADLLKYVCRLEARMEKLFDIISGDMRELRSITELSFEIRSSRTLNENISLKEEISHLNEKIKNQSCLISDLDTKLKELNNERSSLLTVIRASTTSRKSKLSSLSETATNG